LGAEDAEGKKYNGYLSEAAEAGVRKSWRIGFANGLLFASGNIMAAVGFIYGAWKMARELDRTEVTLLNGQTVNCQTPAFFFVGGGPLPFDWPEPCSFSAGDIIVALFGLQMGAQGLGLVEPCLTALAKARKAAWNIMQVMDRKPVIDAFDEGGEKLEKVKGDIVFHKVDFAYPSRPDNPVARGYSLEIKAGQTVALVGASGSGKSTAIQLVERFYDPDDGKVTLDGVDLTKLNVKWLRQQIGLVGQEPVLFGGSIAENIRYGKPGATDEEVVAAAKSANAHVFIEEFPKGYDTDVGEKGGQLSGGQKQRIAIARAIIKNPSILLLDEATSALDTESERVVQKALDDLLAKTKRTTIVIAHRLSTIRNADKICVVDNGKIVEEGTHDELMKKGPSGLYYKLHRGSAE
jgi:ATP-binding cassette subfamily B (MDR/TAP) protein 1